MTQNPTGRRQPVGYLRSGVELNPGQPETNPFQRIERDLNPENPQEKPNALTTRQRYILLSKHERGYFFFWKLLPRDHGKAIKTDNVSFLYPSCGNRIMGPVCVNTSLEPGPC